MSMCLVCLVCCRVISGYPFSYSLWHACFFLVSSGLYVTIVDKVPSYLASHMPVAYRDYLTSGGSRGVPRGLDPPLVTIKKLCSIHTVLLCRSGSTHGVD